MTCKALIIPCRVCAREFESRLPLEFHEAAVAAARRTTLCSAPKGPCLTPRTWRRDARNTDG